MTENHDYSMPQPGVRDWHKPLNRNFERMDRDIEVRDRRDRRSNYTPKDGAKFLATDTGDVFLGTGSTWRRIGTVADADPGPGTGIDTESALLEGNVAALADGLATPRVIDPDSTATPVQDALDAIADNGGGHVRLPPTTISERGPIRPYTDTAITGFGPDVTAIEFTNQPTDGVVFGRGGISRIYLSGFALSGPGPGAGDSGVALYHPNGDTQDLVVGRLLFWGWNDSVYRVADDVGPFQCRHQLLSIYECDAGDADGLIEFRSYYGPANWFGTIAAYPTAETTGENTTVFFSRGGTQTVEYLTMGGSAGVALHQTYDGVVHFGNVHWEPTTNPSDPRAIVWLRGRGGAVIDSIVHVEGTAEFAYELGYDAFNGFRPARKVLGPYHELGEEASLSRGVVNLAYPANPGKPSLYQGAPADVTVTHDRGPTGGLRALGDAGTGF